MKTKFLILALLLFATIAEAKFVIILKGGSANNKFNYVYLSSTKCECTGTGSNTCPVNFATMTGATKQIQHPMSEITEYVLAELDKGNKKGSINFKNDLPVRWFMADKENVQIEIENTGITILK